MLLHMCTINENNMMYGSWDLRHDKQSFLPFWVIFCCLTFLTTWKIKILKKWKKTKQNNKKPQKTPENIILHLHTTNDDHMMYGYWDLEHDKQNFLSFWTIFCPFTPLTTKKIKILKK